MDDHHEPHVCPHCGEANGSTAELARLRAANDDLLRDLGRQIGEAAKFNVAGGASRFVQRDDDLP